MFPARASTQRSMTGTLHIFGVRHHGPGSARTLLAALDELKPCVILIECPADAQSAATWAARDDLIPPVALLIHDVETPSHAVYYPFAEYSPEWQAMRWAATNGADVQFIDLPHGRRPEDQPQADDPDAFALDDALPSALDATPYLTTADNVRDDPLSLLASVAGYEDGERWWDAVIEHRRRRDGAVRAFQDIAEAMAEVRAEIESAVRDSGLRDSGSEPPAATALAIRTDRRLDELREAHMRQAIRATMSDAVGPIAVVCGAWHVPALDAARDNHASTSTDDGALLRPLPRRKTAAVWVPWTASRLTLGSGYGAGVRAPGWYAHLWRYEDAIAERWMTRISHTLRDEGIDASPAHAVAAAHLGQTLAALRGRAMPTLEDLTDAAEAVHTHGAGMAIIHNRVVIGEQMGQVPEDAPTTPLAADLARLQKVLRLKPNPAETLLELDLRTDLDRARSTLLRRLTLLDIPWGVHAYTGKAHTGTFRETWRLAWQPEFAVRIIEVSAYGNTLESASAAFVAEHVRVTTLVQTVAGLIAATLAADLPRAVEAALARLDDLAAATSDLGALMDALPGLASAIRYGDVRHTNTTMLARVAHSLIIRIIAGLPAAALALDDESARLMATRLGTAHSAITTSAESPDANIDIKDWRSTLAILADSDAIHGLIAGRAARLLHDAGDDPTHAQRRFAAALSLGADVPRAAAWIDGFLVGSALVLLHDTRLWQLIHEWIASLSPDRFDAVLPMLRRTFSRFPSAERRQLGDRIRHVAHPAALHTHADAHFNHDRAAKAVATVKMILGGEFSP